LISCLQQAGLVLLYQDKRTKTILKILFECRQTIQFQTIEYILH